VGGWDGGREGGSECEREIHWERHSVTGRVRVPGECVRVHACACGTCVCMLHCRGGVKVMRPNHIENSSPRRR
jgi:hypothetical protein